jgi:uncharacterized protein (TIGR02145 family)
MKKNLILMIIIAATMFAAYSKDVYSQNTDMPPYAASTKTWVIESADGTIKQTWSDAIQIPECNKVDFDGGNWDAPEADCRSYTREGNSFYYYSWPYVRANAANLCPSSWRVPTQQDFIDLDIAFGGSGIARSDDTSWIRANYINAWGGDYGGLACGDTVSQARANGYFWSSTVNSSYPHLVYSLCYQPGLLGVLNDVKCFGFKVRCVK